MSKHQVLMLFLVACAGESSSETDDLSGAASGGGGVRGAIFTTTVDGSRVNANIYATKPDVYLDGGPAKNTAALPVGDYVFEVTEPAGKVLLSSDAINCRGFHVSSAGVIDRVDGGGCSHATGVDRNGGITVQLMPYADTPNNG